MENDRSFLPVYGSNTPYESKPVGRGKLVNAVRCDAATRLRKYLIDLKLYGQGRQGVPQRHDGPRDIAHVINLAS
jgi:hypothetical protein